MNFVLNAAVNQIASISTTTPPHTPQETKGRKVFYNMAGDSLAIQGAKSYKIMILA